MFRVKICGITNESDALHAVACGADALGFVFFAGSPRCVDAEQARAIIEKLPAGVVAVGLFVNESPGLINQVAAASGINMVQLHGDETPELCRQIEIPVIKALRVRNAASLSAWQQYRVEGILLDAWNPEKFGGTGETCDWQLAAELALKTTVILAGGLTADNVAEAVRIVKPYAVDVSSGVEQSPGHKDPDKVAAFIANARENIK